MPRMVSLGVIMSFMRICLYFTNDIIHFTGGAGTGLIATATDTVHRADIRGGIFLGGGVCLLDDFWAAVAAASCEL